MPYIRDPGTTKVINPGPRLIPTPTYPPHFECCGAQRPVRSLHDLSFDNKSVVWCILNVSPTCVVYKSPSVASIGVWGASECKIVAQPAPGPIGDDGRPTLV